MTLDEVRTVLETAAWTRETPLVTLFDELVEKCDEPRRRTHHDGTFTDIPGEVTAAFESLTQPTVASGQIVALVLSRRRTCKLPLYEVKDDAWNEYE